MILSEHALKGNGDKLVKEFLSTPESSWLDVRDFCAVGSWYSRVGCKRDVQFHIFPNKAAGKLLICLSCQL